MNVFPPRLRASISSPSPASCWLDSSHSSKVPNTLYLPGENTDRGGSFLISGTYAAMPERLELETGNEVVLEHDLLAFLGLSEWPEPQSAEALGMANLEPTEVDENCARWDTPGFVRESCLNGPGGGGPSGTEGNRTINWFTRGTFERIVVGFEDGTLVEPEAWWYPSRGIQGFSVFAMANGEHRAATMTFKTQSEHRVFEFTSLNPGYDGHPDGYPQLRVHAGDFTLTELTFTDGAVSVGLDPWGCLMHRRGGDSGTTIMGWSMRPAEARNLSDRLVFDYHVEGHPGNRLTLRTAVAADVAMVEVTDSDGNVHTESTSPVASSLIAFNYVYFDRMLDARPVRVRFLDANGELLGERPIITGIRLADIRGTDGPPGTQHSFFGSSKTSRAFDVTAPEYAPGEFKVRHGGTEPFTLGLECDAGNTTVIEDAAPTGEDPIEVVVEYPEGATLCVWRMEPGPSWSVSARNEAWRDAGAVNHGE